MVVVLNFCYTIHTIILFLEPHKRTTAQAVLLVPKTVALGVRI